MKRRIVIVTVAIVLLTGSSPVLAADPDVLHIGFVDSLLKETAPEQRKLIGKEFKDLVLDFTGLKSVVLEGLTPATAAKQLDEEKWHLGVFHGVEFAWMQAKYPKLKPLMIAPDANGPVRAVFVVKKDSNAKDVADLKGKDVSLFHKFHCKLFADKMTDKKSDYFSKMVQTRSVEDALDGILGGKLQGAFVDTSALAFYKSIQPGRYQQLKVLAESATFPPAVIVYREGCLSEKLLNHLKERMAKVNTSDKGRQALEAFHVSRFEPVPDDYQKSLTEIIRAFPAPD